MRCFQSLIALAVTAATAATAAAQDAGNGRTLFEKCLACHAVGPGAANKNGPVLNGIVGRTMGSADGFAYSEAFKAANAAGRQWTESDLDAYLAAPLQFMPKNKMAFAGVKSETDRADLIAYLKTLK